MRGIIHYGTSSILIMTTIYLLFHIGYKVQAKREELFIVKNQIIQARNDIHILKAEWAYLTTPNNIRKLSDKYLSNRLQKANQFQKNEIQMVSKGRGKKKNNVPK